MSGTRRPWVNARSHARTQKSLSRVFGDFQGQHTADPPVHHRHEIHEALPQRNVGDVGAPDCVRPLYFQPFEQVGVDPVARAGRARFGLRMDRLDAHLPQQAHHFSYVFIGL